MSRSAPMDDLAVALLSVGGYSLQRAWDLLEQLRGEMLLDTERVLVMGEADLLQRLERAGYSRGSVTPLMAKRLKSLHRAAKDGVVDRATERLASGDEDGAMNALSAINGFGPVVFRNFLVLYRS